MKKLTLISLISASVLFANNIIIEEAPSQTTRVSPFENKDDTILSYHSSIAKAKQSVVNISTTKKINHPQNELGQMFNDPFFREFFGFNFGIPKERQKSTSLGSGVIISKEGYIVTNYHVIEDSEQIVVTLTNSDKEYKAKLIGSDPKTDLAVIKIDEKNLQAIKFADSSKVLEGDVVFAIGNPFGVGSTITRGIISALNKNNIGLNQYENFIQTDASINPGNSGGALVDTRGALIGINSAILSRGGDSSGIGFAIPSSMVKDITKKLISDGKIDRGYIGVMISNLTEAQKELYQNKEGALISSVEKDFPADKAGLKRGDLVIDINGKVVKSANDLKNIIGSLQPNDDITLKYERNSKIYEANLKLSRGTDTALNTKDTMLIDGLSISNITSDIRLHYKLSNEIVGVMVTEVKPNSKADEFGFIRGDIIMQVGDEIVKDIQSFTKAINDKKGSKTLVWVNRRGIMQGLVVKQN
ncbi:Do family serine endopeptidase [Campylobacter majalis]|uniref:Do family serine endopeptidase n=1 Tax=Campylobacter majalis TaxID=2790656 RepID=UPI003D6844F4